MPSDAPAVKIDGTRALGAEVVLYDRATQDRDALGAELAADARPDPHPALRPPAGDRRAGHHGLEIAAQAAEEGVTAGGRPRLLRRRRASAPASPSRSRPRPRASASAPPSRRASTTWPARSPPASASAMPAATGSICDAILTPRPGALTFPVLARLAGPGLAVTDEEALAAMALAFRHLRIVLEPGGAVSLAAALFRQRRDRRRHGHLRRLRRQRRPRPLRPHHRRGVSDASRLRYASPRVGTSNLMLPAPRATRAARIAACPLTGSGQVRPEQEERLQRQPPASPPGRRS